MGHFWLRNIVHGWHWGDGIVWQVESLLAFVGFFVKIGGSIKRKKGKPHPNKLGQAHSQEHWWHYWENLVSMASIAIGVLFFITIAFFVAPYEQYEEEHRAVTDTHHALTDATNELKATKIELTKTRQDLTDSDRSRLKAVENSKEVVSEIRSILAANEKANEKAWMDAIPTNHSDLSAAAIARLTKIANESGPSITITNDGKMSLASLREERRAREAKAIADARDAELRQKANEELSKQSAADAQRAREASEAESYRVFISAVDVTVRSFTNELTKLAAEVGDRVICSYDKMPTAQTNGLYATINLEANSAWQFELRLMRPPPGRFVGQIVSASSTGPLTASIRQWRGASGSILFSCNDVSEQAVSDARAEAIAKMLRAFFLAQDTMFPLTNSAMVKK